MSVANEIRCTGHPIKVPAAVIIGGETTVKLPPSVHGLGGRNQALALQAALLLGNFEEDSHGEIVVLSGG